VAGTYQMEIDYLTSGPRSYFVSINGASATELDLNGSSFSLPTSTVVPVTLKAGVNTIAFSNATGYSPALDRIAISPVVGASDLSGTVTAKIGISAFRLWQLTLTNSGSAVAQSAEVNQFSLTQDGGSGSCHPKALALFPLRLGRIAAGSHRSVEIPIDFSRCSASARFDSSIVVSANNGADVSSSGESGETR
jgi:alpha-galactosidase